MAKQAPSSLSAAGSSQATASVQRGHHQALDTEQTSKQDSRPQSVATFGKQIAPHALVRIRAGLLFSAALSSQSGTVQKKTVTAVHRAWMADCAGFTPHDVLLAIHICLCVWPT